ncbi:MAG: phosphomannomutase [Chromatiaceae bacterium]|nr:MAG: phosphomannomutase [Chromatiaceae bacterium]
MLIGDLMTASGVSFGTSGARGLVTAMTDRVCYAYTQGFLKALLADGRLGAGAAVGLAADLRPSSPRILAACAEAVRAAGCQPCYYGTIPTPALANYGLQQVMATLMITGSHIPDDRNGIKFNLPSGEILKHDEALIRAQEVALPAARFDADGALQPAPVALPAPDPAAYRAYVERYLAFFRPDWLAGLRVGLYQHSSVASAALYEILVGLGAAVERLAPAKQFIPVDTEAIRSEDMTLARGWAATGRFDALVSTDGDGDRPLIGDEQGTWLRGDVVGILCARALGARVVVTPVSSNTAVEACGWFQQVVRTRIGSPYVIAGMQAASALGLAPIVGYEANGGFLTQTPIERDGRVLPALPTRDAVLVAVSLLGAARAAGRPLSVLGTELPARYTHSDRIRNFAAARSERLLATFSSGDDEDDRAALNQAFGASFGSVVSLDRTDGLRIGFASGEIVHLRPSGNAPELRIYTEAASSERARAMTTACLDQLAGWN